METLKIDIKEPQLYKEVQSIFKNENISASDAVLMFFRWMQKEKGLPHTIAMFNKTTQKAIQDSYGQKDVVKCKDADDLFNRLAI